MRQRDEDDQQCDDHHRHGHDRHCGPGEYEALLSLTVFTGWMTRLARAAVAGRDPRHAAAGRAGTGVVEAGNQVGVPASWRA
jgi:hypothetical protein